MNDPTLTDPCIWYCFKKNRHCHECDCMGVCHATACPYAVWASDANGTEVEKC